MDNINEKRELNRSLGTWPVMVAGVSLVVACSTLVGDFTGFFTQGVWFGLALVIGFFVVLALGMSAADLSVAFPRAGALYDYARAIFGGRLGRFLGRMLGLAFFGMFAFAASGETSAGAFGFKALLGVDWPVQIFVVALFILAAIPNLLGIRTAAWVTGGLLILMLSIRWVFGIAGFLGISEAGGWSLTNLSGGDLTLFGSTGLLTAGVTLAFWSFVGIEVACSLAEEVKNPRKTMPRGIILGLLLILATSLVMGYGVAGTMPLESWQQVVSGSFGNGGESPQLAVGHQMFGGVGYWSMALASVCATLSTLTAGLAAMPRIIFGMARDDQLLGQITAPFGKLHPRFGSPVAAILLTTLLYSIPALLSTQVIEWMYSAAYVWMIIYVIFHLLAFARRLRQERAAGAFSGKWFDTVTLLSAAATVGVIYLAFLGSHATYGLRALLAFGVAATVASLAHLRREGASLRKVGAIGRALATRLTTLVNQ